MTRRFAEATEVDPTALAIEAIRADERRAILAMIAKYAAALDWKRRSRPGEDSARDRLLKSVAAREIIEMVLAREPKGPA